ncbi:MAG: hypothetical protein FRX49_11481 [Trebouxia sp. A1-2]|nr:MAG: hypothetical protein FRX49_11481 [Trebouxia sp. A1-2]
MQGRASYFGPPVSFNDSFMQSPFTPASDGDCGYYNGANLYDNSAITVPASMLAALPTSNPDYPGSCGRCYELRCQTGVVAGNYSSANTLVPYAIAPLELKPVYEFQTKTNEPPPDSFGRMFPGNVLNSSQLLFTDCWNTTDSQGQTSANNTIVVQVTDTCKCSPSSSPATAQACCTNLTHFNLGYSAFERLAHPDYGLMNLEYSDIGLSFSGQMALSTHFKAFTEPPNNKFVVDKWQDTIFFFCRECDQPGYQSFLLSNTSGLQFYVKQNNSSSGTSSLPAVKLTLGTLDPSKLYVAYEPLCNDRSVDLSQLPASEVGTDGYARVTAGLLQNYFVSCIPVLDQITSFAFQPSASFSSSSPVSFCLDDISLLPPTLQTGVATTTPAIPEHPNCYIPDPQPVYQNGSYAPGRQIQSTQSLSNYTVFPFADLEGYDDMTPTLGTCFANTTGLPISPPTLTGLVDACTQQNGLCCYKGSGAGDQESTLPSTLEGICDAMASNGSICQGFVYNSYTSTAFFKGNAVSLALDAARLCLSPNSTAWLLDTALQGRPDTRAVARVIIPPARPACLPQPSNQDSTLAGTLANVCNTIQYGTNTVCQGFVYDNQQEVAFFKGGDNGSAVNTSSVLCSSPTSTAWLRDTATTDGTVRTQILGSPPAPPPPPPSGSGISKGLKTAYGIIAGVLTACVPAFTWLAITYSYRMDKHMVVTEVVKNVRPVDIASRSPLLPVDNAVVRPVREPQGASSLLMSAMQAGRSRSMQWIKSSPSSARRSQSVGDLASSRQLSTASEQASLFIRVQSDMVHNPLLAPGTMHIAPGHVASDTGGTHDARLDSTSEMKSVARQITVRCLRRWDGLLGIRAGSDGLGRRSGIWRDKFDGVRYGVLLLAMRKLNADLLSSSSQPNILAAG